MEQDKLRARAIEKIAKSKKKSIKDAEKAFNVAVNQKIKEMADLITRAGAERLVINDLGIRGERRSTTPHQLTIGSLTPDLFSVNIVGVVVDIGNVTEFTAKTGELRKRCSIILGDKTGSIPMTLWEEHAIAVSSGTIREGTVLKIEGAYTKVETYKRDYDVQLSLSRRGRIIIDPSDVDADTLPRHESKVLTIAELADYLGDSFTDVTIIARVTKLFSKTHKTTKTGGKYIGGFIRDKTGSASLTLWGSATEKVENGTIDEGKVIRFENVSIRNPWGDGTVADVNVKEGRTTFKEIQNASDEDFPKSTPSQRAHRKQLVDAITGDRIEFVGVLTSIRSDFRTKSLWRMTCPQKDCFKGVVPKEDNLYECKKHRESSEFHIRATLRGTISDGTKDMEFQCYDKIAEHLIEAEASEIVEMSKSIGSENYVEKIRKNLVGRHFLVRGNVWTSNNTGALSMTINWVSEKVDFPAETASIIKEMSDFLKIQGKA